MIVKRSKEFSRKPKEVEKPSKLGYALGTGIRAGMGAESGRFIGRLISSRNQVKESNKRLAEIAKKALSGDPLAQKVVASISRNTARFQQGMINKISTGKRTRNAGIIGAAVGASIPVGLGIYGYQKQKKDRKKYLRDLKKYKDDNKKK